MAAMGFGAFMLGLLGQDRTCWLAVAATRVLGLGGLRWRRRRQCILSIGLYGLGGGCSVP